jgi:silicon transporter
MLDPCTLFKFAYSAALLVFSILVIMTLIFNEETKLSQDVGSALAFLAVWFGNIWLGMVEGGQGALVGLPPVQKDLYEKSHPITHKCTTLAHTGDNLDRYLIGRQFLVVMIVFVINLSGAPVADADVLGLPDLVQEIFLSSGVAMILMTSIVGQLFSQVNASYCMLDYIDTHAMVFTLYVSLAIEASGLLHSMYLVKMLFSKLAGKPIETQEAPRTATQKLLFWSRVVMSLAILCFSFAVTLTAVFQGKTTMWEGVPKSVSVILFFVLMCIIGLLEGMQIAFFAVTKLTKAEQGQNPVAMKTCELLFTQGGRNLPAFMIGRQICVTMCFFIIARVTTLDVDVDAGDETVFGVSNGWQAFFNTGILGAIITTSVASISWQLVASAFPFAFLSNPLVYFTLRFCLLLEATGICSAAWLLALIHKRMVGFELDEVFIGTPEERAAKHKYQEDHDEELHVEAGHPRVQKFPVGTHHLPPQQKATNKKIKENSSQVENTSLERSRLTLSRL